MGRHMRRDTPLKNLRAVLLYLARNEYEANEKFFRLHCEKALRKMRSERFFLGRLYLYKIGRWQILWIDPYNYDCLVRDRRGIAKYKNLYGLLL